ncbi:hypothetical protein AB5S17_05240 [Jiella sp. M17.18]
MDIFDRRARLRRYLLVNMIASDVGAMLRQTMDRLAEITTQAIAERCEDVRMTPLEAYVFSRAVAGVVERPFWRSRPGPTAPPSSGRWWRWVWPCSNVRGARNCASKRRRRP